MDVSRRLRYHDMPEGIKRRVGNTEDRNTALTEGHLTAVLAQIETFLSGWVNWQEWRIEALKSAISKLWSSRQLGDRWQVMTVIP